MAERIIAIIEDFNHKKPPAPLLITFDAEEVRKQAAASTKRFEEGSVFLPLGVCGKIDLLVILQVSEIN